MTQAISLSQILRNEGHELCSVIVGKSKKRKLPDFFVKQINTKIAHLDSPNFVTDKNQKSVKTIPTIFNAIINSRKYLKSVSKIHTLVEEHQPDVIVNFYDFLGGIYCLLKNPKCKVISLAHQFLIDHPQFDFPSGRMFDRVMLKLANKIVSIRSSRILALSFQKFDDVPKKRLYVVPPLLRKEVREIKVSDGHHLLVYMLNPGYATEVNSFHQKYPLEPLHCFWDKADAPTELKIDEQLSYHLLDDKKFIDKMASSRGYVTTAGFESVCEAMYLGKPVLMVPVEGHYEQACNAIDAHKAGAGIYSNSFEIEKLIHYLPRYQDVSTWFRKWADQAPNLYLKYLR